MFTKNQSDIGFPERKSAFFASGSSGRIISQFARRKKIMAKLQTLELITRVGSKRDGYWLVRY